MLQIHTLLLELFETVVFLLLAVESLGEESGSALARGEHHTFSLFQRLDYSTTDARQIIQCKGMKESGEEAIAFVPDTSVFVMLLLL